MRYPKLITAGILILTFLFVNELQNALFLKIESAGNKIRQNELVAHLWTDNMGEKEIGEGGRYIIRLYPQVCALSDLEKAASKLIAVVKQGVVRTY